MEESQRGTVGPEIDPESKAPFQQAQLLPIFYKLVALSMGGKTGACFKLKSFKFGYMPDLMQASEDPLKPDLPIHFPNDGTAIDNVFFEREFKDVDIRFVNGLLVLKCVLPRHTLTEATKYNATGLYDSEDNLVAVSIDTLSVIQPSDGFEAQLVIKFPIVEGLES